MSTTSPQQPMRAPSRRTVLRAGAHAAWAVPAIQIAAAAPAFAAASGTTYPTSQLGLTVLGHARKADGTGYIIVQVTAGTAPAKNVVVTVSGFDSRGTTVTSGPFTVAVGDTVRTTIPLSFGTRARTLQVVATGDTDNAGAAKAVGKSVSYSVPTTTQSTVRTAVLTITQAKASHPSLFASTVNASFTIGTDLAAKNVTWTVTRSDGTVFATGKVASIAANGSVSVTTTGTASWFSTLTFTATATTNDANAYPADPATATATAI